MAPEKYTLRITEPCSESWHRMQLTDRGRLCGTCEKTVVDFTCLSDRQLLEWLNAREKHTCGRFAPEQLNRVLSIPGNPGRLSRFSKVLTGAALLVAATWPEHSAAQKAPAEPRSMRAGIPDLQAAAYRVDSTKQTTVITGTVSDLRSKEVLPGVHVLLKGSRHYAVTNVTGWYSIEIPAEATNPILTFSAIGFATREMAVTRAMLQAEKSLSVCLSEDAMLMGEVVVTGYGDKPHWWQIWKHIFK